MKSSFPKRVKHHSKKWPCNADAKFGYYILEKSFLDMNKCIGLYMVSILEKSSSCLSKRNKAHIQTPWDCATLSSSFSPTFI